MGFYYSLYEWYHPVYRSDPKRYVAEHMLPQLTDAVKRYKPSLIFADGEWDHPSALWRSCEFLAWLFNASPCKDDVVVNDRWGKETRSRHGGYYTSEYGHVGGGKKLAAGKKWEENQGMGRSFGYNRNEDVFNYKTSTQLLHMLIETVSKGGNLLLDIGPTADGRIPVIMQQRLIDIGAWLDVNGESIYGTQPWRGASSHTFVRYTAKANAIYAICLRWPGRELVLDMPTPTGKITATLLGHKRPLTCRHADGKLRIDMPSLSVDEVPSRHAHVFKLIGVK
jgi:alpha-L-fucosidase